MACSAPGKPPASSAAGPEELGAPVPAPILGGGHILDSFDRQLLASLPGMPSAAPRKSTPSEEHAGSMPVFGGGHGSEGFERHLLALREVPRKLDSVLDSIAHLSAKIENCIGGAGGSGRLSQASVMHQGSGGAGGLGRQSFFASASRGSISSLGPGPIAGAGYAHGAASPTSSAPTGAGHRPSILVTMRNGTHSAGGQMCPLIGSSPLVGGGTGPRSSILSTNSMPHSEPGDGGLLGASRRASRLPLTSLSASAGAGNMHTSRGSEEWRGFAHEVLSARLAADLSLREEDESNSPSRISKSSQSSFGDSIRRSKNTSDSDLSSVEELAPLPEAFNSGQELASQPAPSVSISSVLRGLWSDPTSSTGLASIIPSSRVRIRPEPSGRQNGGSSRSGGGSGVDIELKKAQSLRLQTMYNGGTVNLWSLEPDVRKARCSFSDVERLSMGWYIAMPSSTVRLGMDFFALLAIAWTLFAVPVDLVYLPPGAPSTTKIRCALQAADVVWLFHVVLNFFTAISKKGRTEVRLHVLAWAYMRSWLLPDLATLLPVALTPQESSSQGLLAFKLLRLLRIRTVLKRLSRLRTPYLHSGMWVLKVLLYFFFGVNFCCCAWRLTRMVDLSRGGGVRVVRASLWAELYVEDVYWLLMTLSTVGYGDIVASGPVGRLFASAMMMLAPAFFGIIVSLLSRGMKRIFDDETEIQVSDAIAFMQHRHVPLTIQRRVELSFRHHISTAKGMSISKLYQNISVQLQRDLSFELLKSTVLEFPLFEEAPRPFVAEISNAHTWVQCLPWDLVVETGQRVEEVVFVISGRITMQHHSREFGLAHDMLTQDLKENQSQLDMPSQDNGGIFAETEFEVGGWWGEKCLFDEDRIRIVTGFASVTSELAVLLAQDYHRIIQKYPTLLDQHRSMQKDVETGRVSLSEIEYTPRPAGDRTFTQSPGDRKRKSLFEVVRRMAWSNRLGD